MQLIELHHIDAQFHAASRFQRKGLAILESHQLYTDTLQVVQTRLIKFLDEELSIWLQHTMRAGTPRAILTSQVGIIEKVVAVVHQIGLKSGGTHCLHIHRNKSQIYIQHIPTLDFLWLGKSLYSSTHWILLGGSCSSIRRSWLRLLSLELLFPFCLSALFLCSTGNVILIRLNGHDITQLHRNGKAIGIFHQSNVLPLKTHNDATTDLT